MYLNMGGNTIKDITNIQTLLNLNKGDMTATLMENIKYFSLDKRKGKESVIYVTVWIIGDLNTSLGREMLLSALEYMVTIYYQKSSVIFSVSIN